MKTKIPILITFIMVMVLLIGGCVPLKSLHPLFTEEDVIFDSGLVGKWRKTTDKDKNETFEFRKLEDNNYLVITSEKEVPTGMLEGHLLKLGEYTFLDLSISKENTRLIIKDFPDKEFPVIYNYAIELHTFHRVLIESDTLRMGFLSSQWFGDMRRENKININYAIVEDSHLLTDSTKVLQEFVTKYADDEKAFVLDKYYRLKEGN